MSTALSRIIVRTVLLAVLAAVVLPMLPVGSLSGGLSLVPAAAAQADDDDGEGEDGPARTGTATQLPSPAASPTMTLTPTVTPTPTPPPLPNRDWRKTGFASVVDGQLYDPFCRPLRSVGSNVPNLMFRLGLRENLEWMRQHQIRWMRVIATGHGQTVRLEEARPGVVEQRLAELLREVEAFNATHPPHEAIYVLVSLTDYYEPGVPGDQYGYDHPNWCNARVLNAPWYRRGVTRYSFEQECGGGKLTDAPNYEVHFKPWVERIVAAGARSPALLGWQLGNEMKARDSQRNNIDEAFEWYVDWTADMTDTIRRIDQNHLVFAGAQYMAELSDWPYRPDIGGGLHTPMLKEYKEFWEKMLRGCKTYCWNVWSLTDYDFRHYALDDAMFLRERGVAAMMTEYGFTIGTEDEERQRFGGDRRVAHRSGLARPWQDLDGVWHDRNWGTLELVERSGVQGIAPWGSPAPFPDAHPWIDLDRLRGISLAREGDELWQIWRQIAANLELGSSNRGLASAGAASRAE